MSHAAPDIGLTVRLVVQWDDSIPDRQLPTNPDPDAGGLVVPGHTPLPRRPGLDPSVGPGGLAARVLDANNDALPIALWSDGTTDKNIGLPDPPLALVPRPDGVWALSRQGVLAADFAGETVISEQAITATKMMAAGAHGVWLVGDQRCWYCNSLGEVAEFDWVWSANAKLWTAGGHLVGIHTEGKTVIALDRFGTTSSRTTSVELGPFDTPLAGDGDGELDGDGDGVLASSLNTVSWLTDSGTDSFVLAGAGLTDTGAPFLAGWIDNRCLLWVSGRKPVALPIDPADQVVAVMDEDILTWSGSSAIRWRPVADSYQPEATGEGLVDIAESAWTQPNPSPMTAGEPGQVLLSCSGPTGMVVLSFRWPAT